jgi:hypothetical protein
VASSVTSQDDTDTGSLRLERGIRAAWKIRPPRNVLWSGVSRVEPAAAEGSVEERILAALSFGPCPPEDVAAAAGLEKDDFIAEVGWLVFAGLVKTDRQAPRNKQSGFPFGPLVRATL